MASQGRYYRNCRRILRLHYRQYSTHIEAENTGAIVYVCRHRNAIGPLACLCVLPLGARPWAFAPFMDPAACREHLGSYTFPVAQKKNPMLSRILAAVLGPLFAWLVCSSGAIPVYRNSLKVRETFQQSMKALEEGDRLLIFPDVNYAEQSGETGALYDVPAVAAALRRSCPDAILHVDATQAYLKVPFSVKTLGCGLLTLSSHKIEGPKGTGALWVDPGVIRNRGLSPILLGGGQETGLRSGTEDPPSCAAFAKAAAVGYSALSERVSRLTELRERLLATLASDPRLSGVRVNLPPVSAPHIVSLTLPRIKSETMLHALSARGIYVSSGSACSSHGKHGTSALSAFGLSDPDADATIRVSFSHRNTTEQVDLFCDALSEEIARLARF